MPARSDVHYFGAGPAPLPTLVLEKSRDVLLNYNNMGIGITEISHRSAEAKEILDRARTALKKLLDIPESDGPDGYEVLFMQGGGSGQFSAAVSYMVGHHLGKLKNDDRQERVKQLKLDYLVTGSWSLKASQEAARLLGKEHVNIAVDSRKFSKAGTFDNIPAESEWTLSPSDDSAMVYYCDNETVDGVEFPTFPRSLLDKSTQVVADMSSNFLSRDFDIKNFAAVFAGAQKNVGTTGITIVIVKKQLLPPHATLPDAGTMRSHGMPQAPVVLDWATIAKNDSLYNTLPIFDVWIAGQVMDLLLSRSLTSGPRLLAQRKESDAKAALLYSTLDKYPNVYQIVPSNHCRSRMNICFRVGQGDARQNMEKEFLAAATAQGLAGCKGHRSVGGCRISNCESPKHV